MWMINLLKKVVMRNLVLLMKVEESIIEVIFLKKDVCYIIEN